MFRFIVPTIYRRNYHVTLQSHSEQMILKKVSLRENELQVGDISLKVVGMCSLAFPGANDTWKKKVRAEVP